MRTGDTRSFSAESYRETVRGMRSRGESVHDAGTRHRQRTGEIHPYVDVRQNRGSHNAMVAGEDGTAVLRNGIAVPFLSQFDGTGSTAQWLSSFFHAAERQHRLLAGAGTRYNMQLASSVVQDVVDRTPVVQLSQFETDHRSAEQVRLLQPDGGGGDATEDYDLGLAVGLGIYADLWTYYGLKGYFTVTLDEIGRGFVNPRDVERYFGWPLEGFQGDRIPTHEICERLLDRWHLFILKVPGGRRTIPWWQEIVPGRVIEVDDPRLLAEVRAALVYVTEAEDATQAGLGQFLSNGNDQVDPRTLDQVWRMVQSVGQNFGAQAALPGYHEIPLPGDVFEHYRHAWPTGHVRAGENVTPEDTEPKHAVEAAS